MYRYITTLIIALLASSAFAKNTFNPDAKSSDGATEAEFNSDVMTYVEANVLATLYHEVGHALIDKLNLPIYAREEDAADYFAVLLSEYLLPPDMAEYVTWASADQYLQAHHKYLNYEPYYAGVHSLDLVRYYNTLCIYYGGAPRERYEFAREHGLPETRMDTCQDERRMVEHSWGTVIDTIVREAPGFDWLVIDEYAQSRNEYVIASHKVIEDAVKMLNDQFSLTSKVRVRMTECNEDNAFYDPSGSKILMCNELIPPLSRRRADVEVPNANH